MHIELVNSYSTDIQDILALAKNDNACFISSWDKNDQILNIDANIVEKSVYQQEHKNTYIMSKDMDILKDKIISCLTILGCRHIVLRDALLLNKSFFHS